MGMVRDKGLNDAEIRFFNFDASVFVALAVSNAIRSRETVEWIFLVESAVLSLLTR
jgi:hypothetical protein